MRKLLPWLGLAALVIVLDQWSKLAITLSLTFGDRVVLTPFFDLVLTYNTGAAFSFLSNASGWQREFFIAIALLASIWILYMLYRHAGSMLMNMALALVLGGAIGNVIDRFRFGAVVDFLHFHIAEYSWPAFNVADSAITVGAVLLIWDSFRPGSRTAAANEKPRGSA
ncbi:MAG: signal peptidase II [Burkholderiales bacterium]|nr:lipoprotein signal peptidase [Burkholderiales bacterium]MDQ3194798.1 signal peptidase II [Pseudomonadota bacterium]